MVAVPPRQLSKMVYLHWKRLNIYSRADLPYPLINKTTQLLCNKVHISIRSSKTSKPRNYFNFGPFASIVVRAAIVRRLYPSPAHLAPEHCVCPAGVGARLRQPWGKKQCKAQCFKLEISPSQPLQQPSSTFCN